MNNAPHAPQSPQQAPERPGGPTRPPEPSQGSPETQDEAPAPDAPAADTKTARQKIANLLWWSVPSSTDEEAKERTEQLLDEHHAEVLAGNADAAAERDCLAMGVMFALQWKPDAPMGLREGIEEILTTMPAANAAPDFFRPGRTYAYDASGFAAPELLTVFRVVATTMHPETGKRTAFGWIRGEGDKTWTPYAEPADEWPASWTDITATGEATA